MTYRSKRRTRSAAGGRRRARFAKHSDGAGAIDALRVKGEKKKLLNPHEVKTNVPYKELRNVNNPKLIKFQEAPKRSGKVPVLANKGYTTITNQMKGLIASLANLQTVVNTQSPNNDSFGGLFQNGKSPRGFTQFNDKLYDGLSIIHREKVDKRLEKMMISPLGRKLSDTDWDDIFVDLGIVQKRSPGQLEYAHSDIKATALEIIDKFTKTKDENGNANVPNLSTPEYMSHINKELKELRNDLIRNSKNVTDTPAVLRGDVLSSYYLKTNYNGVVPTGYAKPNFLRINAGLANNTDTGAQEIVYLVTEVANSIKTQTPRYVADNDLDTDQYTDGKKKHGSSSRKSRSKRSKRHSAKRHSARDGAKRRGSKRASKRRSKRRV
jgi:hypothetical protein